MECLDRMARSRDAGMLRPPKYEFGSYRRQWGIDQTERRRDHIYLSGWQLQLRQASIDGISSISEIEDMKRRAMCVTAAAAGAPPARS
jgi:hypothetical protein